MGRIFLIGVIGAIAVLVVFGGGRIASLLKIASGSTSQNVCSATFVSGLDADRVYLEDVRGEPGMGLIAWALNYNVDPNAHRVSTTIFGLFATSSSFQEGYGCRLNFAGAVPLTGGARTAIADPPVNDIAGADLVAPSSPELAKALDEAFLPAEAGQPKYTRAIVVVHNGRIVAERYGEGIDANTPLLSHSIAKSVTNALVGVLVREGKLQPDRPLTGAAWEDQPTIDQMLRMTSGLPLDEGIGPGLAQQMWFVERDGDAFARATQLAAKPGTAWAYGNLGYTVLSRAVRDAVGGKPQSVAAFARQELFEPLGMRRALMEFDAAGTPMGGNAFYATARDWARFGLLYLNDGVVNGRRILPEGWVAYSTRQTLDAGYGAGFWLNVTDAPMKVWPGARWGMPGAPKDAFFARGYLGQYIVVVPSENLVVVRMGVTRARGGGIAGIGKLVQSVIAALRS